jgi:hypothetical protein
MRSLLALLAAALLGVGTTGCGDAGNAGSTSQPPSDTIAAASDSSGAVSSATSPGGYSKKDGDKDNDDNLRGNKSAENDDAALLHSYGGDVAQVVRQEVTALVRRYYTAALAADGVRACSLLSASLAGGVAEEPAQPSATTNSCASTVAALFRQQHTQLAADDVPTMGVTEVRAKGNLGLAVLGFRRLPEGEILIAREGGAWKIDSLLDSEMP